MCVGTREAAKLLDPEKVGFNLPEKVLAARRKLLKERNSCNGTGLVAKRCGYKCRVGA